MTDTIDMKTYVGLPLEERTKVLQEYIENHQDIAEAKKNKHIGKDLMEMALTFAQTNVTLYSQLTEATKLLTDASMALIEDDKKTVQELIYTLQLMNEQNRMLVLEMVASYEQDVELQLIAMESLTQTLGGTK